MATKNEIKLATILLKERLERLTGKKVVLKEGIDYKTLVLKFIELNLESIKKAIRDWKQEGFKFSQEDNNGNTIHDFIYDEIENHGKTFESFLQENGINIEIEGDNFDATLYPVLEKKAKEIYKSLI